MGKEVETSQPALLQTHLESSIQITTTIALLQFQKPQLSVELESTYGVDSKSFIAVLAFDATRNRGNEDIWPLKWKKRYRSSHVDIECVIMDRPVSSEARITC